MSRNRKDVDVRYFIICGVCVLLMIAGILYGTQISNVHDSKLQELQTRINDLTAQIAEQKSLNDMADNRVVYEDNGVNAIKVEEDRHAIESFCQLAFTWNSYADYTAARDMMLESYHVPEDSYFMRTFFPEMEEYTGEDGVLTNDIDRLHINCSFEKCTIHLSNMFGDTYSYIVFVDFSSQSQNYYEATSRACVFVTLDAQQNMSAISAYTAY